MRSRRTTLQLLAAGLAGVTGCATQREQTDASTARPSSPSPTATATDTPQDSTPTDSPEPSTGISVEGAQLAWERSLGGRIDAGPVVFGDSLVVAAGGRFYWLDRDTGETSQLLVPGVVPDDRGRPDTILRVRDGTLYAVAGISFGTGAADYQLLAIDPDGSTRWERQTGLGGFHSLLGFGDGAIVIATGDDAVASAPSHPVVAFDTATGERRWGGESGDAAGGAVSASRAVVQTYGAVDGFRVADGRRQFRYTPDDTDIADTAAGDGLAFVGLERFDAPDGVASLVALDEAGAVAWDAPLGFVNSLRYEQDLFVGGRQLTRLAPDGTVRWRYEAPSILSGVPFDDRAVYTNTKSSVAAVRRTDGTELWTSTASDVAIPRALGGDTLVSADGGERLVFAHDARDGSQLWQASLPGEYPPDPAADASGTYLVTTDGGVGKVVV